MNTGTLYAIALIHVKIQERDVITMAKFFTELDQEHIAFIQDQKLFFVGTAPTIDGRVNVSPKGYDSLRILENNRMMYIDNYGSGNETAAHISENQRITFMWCSFDKKPLILRAYGKGIVIDKESNEFDEYMNSYFPDLEKRIIRQAFLISIESVQTSCGWGVPYMTFVQERPTLDEMSKKHCK